MAFGSSGRKALRFHEKSDELLAQMSAPSPALSAAVMDFMEEMGDYDGDAGEVITEDAKGVLMFTFMRGYTLRLASALPIEVPIPDDYEPAEALLELSEQASDDRWFFSVAFPEGRKTWEKLTKVFHGTTVKMLREDNPTGPTWPRKVIDDMLRMGYMGGHVDQWFDLPPMYRD
jgi:hypothetical protein